MFLQHSYGFINCCERELRIFFHYSQINEDPQDLSIGGALFAYFCGAKHQNQKLMKVFPWLWVKKEKSGLGWGAITLQDSFLCFLGKNDESPFLNFFLLLNSPWFYPPISVFQLSLLVFYLCLFCAICPQMKWNLKFHQISEQENPSHVVWWDLKLGLFPLRFVTWPPRLLSTVNAKCEKNFVLASVIKTPKSRGGSGLKYYPSVLQESQQLFFCCRSSSSYYWHVFEFVPIWITLQSYICLFNWNWTCLWNTQTIIDINPICWQINFIFRFEVRKQYVEW